LTEKSDAGRNGDRPDRDRSRGGECGAVTVAVFWSVSLPRERFSTANVRKRRRRRALLLVCAKEAAAKALGTGISRGVSWKGARGGAREPGGRPTLHLSAGG